MKLSRWSWLVVVVVVVVVFAVPGLRRQLRAQAMVPREVACSSGGLPELGSIWLPGRREGPEDPVRWVESRFPDDPKMLMAAGLVTNDVSALRRAAEESNDAVAWAALAEVVERQSGEGAEFRRIGSWGVDPADAAMMAEEQKRFEEAGGTKLLDPKAAGPVLEVLERWQQADPKNDLPAAFRARYLYAMGRDDDALSAWVEAGRLPEATLHVGKRQKAVRRYLIARGMPEPEAIVTADAMQVLRTLAILRGCARIAMYEGSLAAMEGRPKEAVLWWQSTADLGQHVQQSADTLPEFLVGVPVEAIGAAPVWQWRSDEKPGMTGGPVGGGRLFHGRHHGLYVSQVGEEADAALRDRLIKAKLRVQGLRGFVESWGSARGFLESSRYLGFAGMIAGVGAGLFVLFLAVGTWSRRAADGATRLSRMWQLAAAVLILAPTAVVPLMVGFVWQREPSESAFGVVLLLAPFGLTLVAGIVVPLVAAARSRAAGARLRTAWRGNVRRITPVTLALCALLFLGFSVAGMRLREQWAKEQMAPGVTEMSQAVAAVGERWTNPTIPADAWRAGYPPETPKRQP